MNKNFESSTTEAELKANQDKIVKKQIHDISYFLGKGYFGDDGFKNIFDYQPTPDTLD